MRVRPGPPGEEDLYALELSIGVSYLLGGRRAGEAELSASPGAF